MLSYLLHAQPLPGPYRNVPMSSIYPILTIPNLNNHTLCVNAKWQMSQVGWMLANHRNELSSFLAWSAIAQSDYQQATSLLEIGSQRPSGFESCIQQRKTTCLLSIRKSLACARASKLTTTNMYIARARCECQMAVGSGGLNACWSQGWAVEFKFFSLIRDSSVGLSAGIQSAGDWVSETLWVRILHSAEEDNLSPFDSKIACLCQSSEINNNKYVYRQSQVRMPNGSGLRWAECLLIVVTGCRVQLF